MDNRNLVQWSQRLYQAIVDANLPPAQLQDVAQALRARTPWARLTSVITVNPAIRDRGKTGHTRSDRDRFI
jgi:hypothetical protein